MNATGQAGGQFGAGAVSVSRLWYRAVWPQHRNDPLGYYHTPNAPSRFNAGAGRYPLLYLAPDRITALLEVRALVRIPGQAGLFRTGLAASVLVCRVRVDLTTVIDLGDPGTRSQTVQELTGDWRTYPILKPNGNFPDVRSGRRVAPTQDLGAKLFAAGPKCEAFMAPSAVNPKVCNLVIFPNRVNISYSPSLKIESK